MNKKYTYGVAALVLIGTTLIGSSLYAADMLPKISNVLTPVGNIQMHRGAENMLTSLSGFVSQEALTELKALMDTHKAKIDALKASGSGTTFDQAAFTALKTEHQTALDALKKKYPELETALKNMKGHGMGFGGGRDGGMKDIFAALPTDVTTKIQAIHTAYEAKFTALKDQESAEVLAQLEAYPDAKKAYQEIIQNKANGMGREGKGKGGKRGSHGGEGRGGFGMKMRTIESSTSTAQ